MLGIYAFLNMNAKGLSEEEIYQEELWIFHNSSTEELYILSNSPLILTFPDKEIYQDEIDQEEVQEELYIFNNSLVGLT